MNVRIDKSFDRDIKKINDKKVLIQLAEIIEHVQNCDGRDEIHNIRKLKGSNNYFRIRTGKYRIGISIQDDTVDFIRFLPRKDIYKYFP
jgi:mRNA interferase RelE/StbE